MQVFAPANLRAAADNTAYADLISASIADKYTLRYTGGFVPDVNHIMTKVHLCIKYAQFLQFQVTLWVLAWVDAFYLL